MRCEHSRSTLRSIDYSPFDEDVLEELTDVNGCSGRIYLLYQCICRYLNLFSEKYHFPTGCDVETIFLSRRDLFDSDCACEFMEEAEYNAHNLLVCLVGYCNWDFAYALEMDLREAGLDTEIDEDMLDQIEKCESITENGKRLFKKMPDLVEEAIVCETISLYILQISGLPEYLRYKEKYPESVKEKFLQESFIINQIMDEIGEVMISGMGTYFIDNSEEFVMGWLAGSDGYYYYPIGYLNPNWLISMYVLHGLLEHAQRIFQYSTKGKEKDG